MNFMSNFKDICNSSNTSLKLKEQCGYILLLAYRHNSQFYQIEPTSNVEIMQHLQTNFTLGIQLNRLYMLDIIGSHILSLLPPFLHLWASVQANYPKALLSPPVCLPSSMLPPFFLLRWLSSSHSRGGGGQ